MAYRILIKDSRGLWKAYGHTYATKADAVRESKRWGKSMIFKIERVSVLK